MKPSRIILFVALAALIALFFVFDLQRFITLEFFAAQREAIIAYEAANPWTTAVAFFVVYVLVTGTSLPGAALLTLIAGAVFGLAQGVVMVSFASTLGATMAFTIARYLFRDAVRARFGQYLATIDRGVEREGAFYLFALRLVPAVPFFAINLAMALTPISTWRFYWVSQVGMFFGTVVYVNAGAELGQIESVGDILSPALWISFALLGLAPLIAKKILDAIKSRKVLRKFDKPKRFDNNLVVIGAGSERPCRGADRRHRQGQGDVDRAPPHGRRLPEHGLRAEQVAAALRQNAVLRRPREGIRLPQRQRRVRLQRGDGARTGHHPQDRAPRLGGTL